MTSETPPTPEGETDAERIWRQTRELARKSSSLVQQFGFLHAPLFELGRVVATPGALDLLERTNTDAAVLLNRHRCGDWGAISPHDVNANESALHIGAQIRKRPQHNHAAAAGGVLT
jgi:hypothetical protein